MFIIIIKLLAIVSLLLYIYKNSLDERVYIKNFMFRVIHRNDPVMDTTSVPYDYKELYERYRVPTEGSAKELEKFDDFKDYTDAVFNEENLNPPTGIYSHESEAEDLGLDTPDIYDKEVAK